MVENVEDVRILAEEGGGAAIKVEFLGETMEKVEGDE